MSLDKSGKPDDPALRALWDRCRVEGVPSIAVLKSDGTLVASETGPSEEKVQEAMVKVTQAK